MKVNPLLYLKKRDSRKIKIKPSYIEFTGFNINLERAWGTCVIEIQETCVIEAVKFGDCVFEAVKFGGRGQVWRVR